MSEKRVRTLVIAPEAPDDKSVGWIDNSDWESWKLKFFVDGCWKVNDQGGFVCGPDSAISNNIAIFNDGSGKKISDGGCTINELKISKQKFPSSWRKNGTMSQLISDINSDTSAVVGRSYLSTVSCSDLPASLIQAEMIVEIMDEISGLGKVILFTVTSSNTAPYHWEYTSAYGTSGSWRSFVPSGSLATVATSGSYNDLSNKPSIPDAPIVVTGAFNEDDEPNTFVCTSGQSWGYIKDALLLGKIVTFVGQNADQFHITGFCKYVYDVDEHDEYIIIQAGSSSGYIHEAQWSISQ